MKSIKILSIILFFSSTIIAQPGEVTFNNDAQINFKDTGGNSRGQIFPVDNTFLVTAMGTGMHLHFGDGRSSASDTWFSADLNTTPSSNVPFIVKANSRVGIGTNNPGNLLTVNFPASNLDFSQGIRIQTNYGNYTAGRGGGVIMQNADVNTAGIFGIREENNWKGALTFYTHTSASGNGFGSTFTEKMRLTNSGNLGIGITNPSAKLYINDNTGGAFSTVIKNENESGHGLLIRAGGGTGTRYIMQLQNKDGFNKMTVKADGKVGIGTTSPDAELTVNGNIHTSEVKVDLDVPAPDYVFADDYNLRSLEEVELYTNQNSHLPEIPSAKEMAENGVLLKEMNMKLLQKVEELTLYLIEEHKQNNNQQKRIEELEKEIKLLKGQ